MKTQYKNVVESKVTTPSQNTPLHVLQNDETKSKILKLFKDIAVKTQYKNVVESKVTTRSRKTPPYKFYKMMKLNQKYLIFLRKLSWNEIQAIITVDYIDKQKLF